MPKFVISTTLMKPLEHWDQKHRTLLGKEAGHFFELFKQPIMKLHVSITVLIDKQAAGDAHVNFLSEGLQTIFCSFFVDKENEFKMKG